MKTNQNTGRVQKLDVYQTKSDKKLAVNMNTMSNTSFIKEKNGEVFVYSNLNDDAAFDLPHHLFQIPEMRRYATFRSRFYFKEADGLPFLSAIPYIKFIEEGIKYLGFVRIREFFYDSRLEILTNRLQILKSKLKTDCNDKDTANNIECAFLSYINYLQFKNGTHDMHGFKRDKKVKVTFLSSKNHLRLSA